MWLDGEASALEKIEKAENLSDLKGGYSNRDLFAILNAEPDLKIDQLNMEGDFEKAYRAHISADDMKGVKANGGKLTPEIKQKLKLVVADWKKLAASGKTPPRIKEGVITTPEGKELHKGAINIANTTFPLDADDVTDRNMLKKTFASLKDVMNGTVDFKNLDKAKLQKQFGVMVHENWIPGNMYQLVDTKAGKPFSDPNAMVMSLSGESLMTAIEGGKIDLSKVEVSEGVLNQLYKDAVASGNIKKSEIGFIEQQPIEEKVRARLKAEYLDSFKKQVAEGKITTALVQGNVDKDMNRVNFNELIEAGTNSKLSPPEKAQKVKNALKTIGAGGLAAVVTAAVSGAFDEETDCKPAAGGRSSNQKLEKDAKP